MAGRDRAKRPVGFADDVKPAPQPGGARGVHGEVAGIVDRAFNQFLQVKCARPLQDHWGDLTFAFADMGLQPLRNDPWQLRRKRSRPARRGTPNRNEAGDGDSQKERSQWQRIDSPVEMSFCNWPDGAGATQSIRTAAPPSDKQTLLPLS
jgi:hypothetical protein